MRIKKETEKSFMETVVSLAKLKGWLVYHTYDSRKSEPGFPDLVIVRDGEVMFIELKTDTGAVTEEQDKWIEALRKCEGENLCVVVWRPSKLKEIEVMLK